MESDLRVCHLRILLYFAQHWRRFLIFQSQFILRIFFLLLMNYSRRLYQLEVGSVSGGIER